MKFNFSIRKSGTVKNYMGATAYKLAPELELYTAVATCMVDDSYYEKKGDRLKRIKELVVACDPAYVAKLAVYARTGLYLRSVPVVLAVELAKVHSGTSLVRRLIPQIVLRADEIKEVLAYYQLSNDRKGTKQLNRLSRQLQKGLAASFNRFDEYQFAKYDTSGAVDLKDALFLVHPKAKDATQQEIFDRIASGTLATPYTWETELSELGRQAFGSEAQKAAAVAVKWEELVASGKLGYMAVLRNLRNIITKGTETACDGAVAILTDARMIKASRQLPFRYLSAYEEIEKLAGEQGLFESEQLRIRKALQALETALAVSCGNIRTAPGRTAILSDNSGSMRGDAGGGSLVSAMSRRKTADIANLFAVLYRDRCEDAYVGLFGDRLIAPELRRDAGLFENFRLINEAAKKCGPGTERGIFEFMDRIISKRQIVDRIVIFSDCQVGTGCSWYDNRGNQGSNFNRLLQDYRKINPAVKVYSVDLKGYGNTMVREDAVLVGGWSDRIFDMIYAVEEGVSVTDRIRTIAL